MAGNSNPPTTSTNSQSTTSNQATGSTTQVLSPEQQTLLGWAMPYLQQFATQPPNVGASNTVAPFNATQQSGQAQVLGGTGAQQGIVGSAGDASQFLTSGAALDPSTNAGLRGTIEAAQRPIFENLNESIIPGIRQEAIPGANYGGTRQGIAEGIATKGAIREAGDVGSKLAFAGYQSGLDAMTKALGLAPATAGAQSIPGATTSAVGDVQQQQQQRVLDANALQQWLPLILGQTLAGQAGSIPGGTVTSTGTTTGTGTNVGTSVGSAPQSSLANTLLGAGSVASGLLGNQGIAGLGGWASSILPFL